MKNISLHVFIVFLSAILCFSTSSASADDAAAPLTLPDLVSFSNGIGAVRQTGQESNADSVTFSYQCLTADVESVVREYIRELRKFGIYIALSEKTVYDSATNDANYGVALRDTNTRRARFTLNDSFHEWLFEDISVYIAFSTGGNYGSQYIMISYARGSYKIADTGAKMQTNRQFSPADYYFYRNQLETDAQKTAYDYILSKTEAMETPISLAGLPERMDYDEFFLVWYSVLVDNPQIFTVINDTDIGEIKYFSDGTVRSFHVYYSEDKKDLPGMKKAYEQAIAEALKVIDPYMTDYQKELALHDWLCDHIRYDHSLGSKSAGSYSALVKGSAVCEGYSEAFTELLHRAGIEAATVYGFVIPEENFTNNSHAWNIVCLDGNWYYTDVTWDDTSGARYAYLNRSTAQMAVDHVNGIGTFPLCNSFDVPSGSAVPADRAEEEAESAEKAIRNMKIGWNLGNSFDSTGDWILQETEGKVRDFETAWGNPVTPADLMARLKAMGFNAVRIPITWNHHITSHRNIDRAWLKRIREVVDQAMDAGLYCIINVHHDTGSDYGWLHASRADYEEHWRQFASIWRQIANYFKDYPDKLLFEGFNEMLDDSNEWSYPSDEGNQYITAYNQLFVDTVRATGGMNATRNLVVTTYAAAVTEEALRGFSFPKDTVKDHLIADVHFYSPLEFTFTGAGTWTGPEAVYSSYVENTVDEAFARIGKYLGKTPLIIGEFGAENKGNTQHRIKWYTHVVKKAKSIGAVCYIWDNGLPDGMGLIQRNGTNDPFPEIVAACINAAK